MLEFCDKENKIAYLETNNDKNVSLYEHFGFQLMNETLLPNSSIAHYSMMRTPSSTDEE